MADTIRKRGKRGASNSRLTRETLHDIHSVIRGIRPKQDGHKLTGTSVTALAAERAIYNDHAAIEEDRAEYIVPRQSLTRKHLLPFFPQRLEFATIPTRQLDKASLGKKRFTSSDEAVKACRMIATEENRVEWKSDTTLLDRVKQFQPPASFKREGSISQGAHTRKYTVTLPEPEPAERIIGTAVEGADIDEIE